MVKADVKVWPQKLVEDGAILSASLIWGDRWARSLFGAYGITGLGNVEISPEFAAKLGAAFGATLREHAIVCASRDPHRTCRLINRAMISGFLSAGVDVHDFRVAPIPVVRYQMGKHGAVAGCARPAVALRPGADRHQVLRRAGDGYLRQSREGGRAPLLPRGFPPGEGGGRGTPELPRIRRRELPGGDPGLHQPGGDPRAAPQRS